ncbi:MAG: UDP-N-acetylmuramoyl-L-alanine--D-glutamate ligase [Candidatus Binataceae bacterium]
MNEFAGKRIAVIGLGRSGISAARFLSERGADLVLFDRSCAIARNLLPSGEVHLGREDPALLDGVELVITSPGAPPDNPLLRAACMRGLTVIGELELASRFFSRPIIAITGTNGKSTVTMLVGQILQAAGKRVFVGGNLGTPLIEAVNNSYDLAVAEVSSFQLERIDRFHPHAGVYLNLSEDHLDRYRDLDDYGLAKAQLFRNQESEDWAILNRDDPRVWGLADKLRARVVSFGLSPFTDAPAIGVDGGAIVFELGNRRGKISLAGLRLAGRHNLLNVMAAAGAGLVMDAEPAEISSTLQTFTGLRHRFELVRRRGGVDFIDDSKATNVGAVAEALAAVNRGVILIAGGVDKGGDYGPLRAAVCQKVKLLILLGAARWKIREALSGAVETIVVMTLDEAVAIAAARARSGDTVMLSPACSSFDQFKDYAERGDLFKELVRAL